MHYTHCRAHSLILSFVHTCQQSEVKNMFEVVSEIVSFIGASAKRLNVFTESREQRIRLKKLSATRRTRHEETLLSFITNFEPIVETLELLTRDAAAGLKATSYLNSVLNF